MRAILLAAGAILGLAAGALLHWFGEPGPATKVMMTMLLIAGAQVVLTTVRGMLRGTFAADVVASLSIIGSAALVQPVAGLIVVVMQNGGEALEAYAQRRATAALRELERAAPRFAHRVEDAKIVDIGAADVRPGDELLVRPGEMVPADCVVVRGDSHVDVSRVTGEPVPVHAGPGVRLVSGMLNGESALYVHATAIAAESQYARIVELVRTAQLNKAPLQRTADRYAVWFTPLTLLVCLIAYLISGDAVRVLSVLVIATPCPLILATPVAILGGLNRAATRDVIVKNPAALEHLRSVTAAVLDKTGTITLGRPEVSNVFPVGDFDEPTLMRLAAAAEAGSGHLLARSVVEAADRERLEIPVASQVREHAGRGVDAVVDGHRVVVGSRSLLEELSSIDGTAFGDAGEGLRAYVAIDDRPAAVIEFADRVRPGFEALFTQLRRQVRRVLLVSGDHAANVDAVARQLGIAEVHSDVIAAEKAAIVERLKREGEKVLVLGDGTNDAPALSAADVGVALAGHGGGITAEAADMVILADDPARLTDAIAISRRTMRIAHQSIWVGLGLSGIGMLVAAGGAIVPAVGAVLQEVIDVAVILNALRASRDA